jgi:uncharacterized protein (DUF488 family)
MTILTAGYGNRGFEPFIQLLKAHGVTHLVDVRSVPQSSYWEDFRRVRLELIVPPTGLKYIYMGDTLGGVSDSPVLCKDPESVDMAPLFEDPKLELGLRKLMSAAEDPRRKICLMCGCLRPHHCHRSRLLGEALFKRGVELQHVDDKGILVPQSVVVEQARPKQLSLFG